MTKTNAKEPIEPDKMKRPGDLSINIKGHLMNMDVPKVMGILNVTSDSFFPASRTPSEALIRHKAEELIKEGADIIDIGGYSTRPGHKVIPETEEWERVNMGCRIVREISKDIPISIDTFRESIARKSIDKWDIEIINDVSGGVEYGLWELVSECHLPYVLTHNRDVNESLYSDVTAEVITELSKKVNELHRLGLNDIIIDPGFGFSKNIDQNFILFSELNQLALMGFPLLVGISRKSMIYKTLGISPSEALAGTVALNAWALDRGASILRVHDVREAKQTIELFLKMKGQ